MRVNLNLVDSNGEQFPAVGFVNAWTNNETGRICTGKKVYPTLAEALRRGKTPDGCTHEGVINLSEYMNDETVTNAQLAAKEAAIEALDTRLFNLLDIPFGQVIRPAPITRR